MTDFWTQLIQYTNLIENETPDIDNPEHLLSKILTHAEHERQLLEAQVGKHSRICNNYCIVDFDFFF